MVQDQSLREPVTHGTPFRPIQGMDFLMSDALRTVYPDRFSVALHWHPQIELLWIRQGTFTLQLNLETFQLNEGDFCFIGSEALHQLSGLEEDTWHQAMLFDPQILNFTYHDELQEDLLAPLLRRELHFLPVLTSTYPTYNSLSPLLMRLFTDAVEKEDDPSWYIRCKLQILELLYKCRTAGLLQATEISAPQPDLVRIDRYKKVSSYIEEHLSDPLTLEELAQLADCNRQYFCRFFRGITGQPPMQYIISRRIDKACQLLESSNKTVLEISMDCGFENVSYFIRKFRQLLGCTPGEYARQHKKC